MAWVGTAEVYRPGVVEVGRRLPCFTRESCLLLFWEAALLLPLAAHISSLQCCTLGTGGEQLTALQTYKQAVVQGGTQRGSVQGDQQERLRYHQDHGPAGPETTRGARRRWATATRKPWHTPQGRTLTTVM